MTDQTPDPWQDVRRFRPFVAPDFFPITTVDDADEALIFEAHEAGLWVLASEVDAARVLDAQRLQQAQQEAEKWQRRCESLAAFNPDWDRLEASQDSLREHMVLLKQAQQEIADLKGAAAADDARLRAAAARAGITDTGCDTADALADLIDTLHQRLQTAEQERDRAIHQRDEPCVYEICGCGTVSKDAHCMICCRPLVEHRLIPREELAEIQRRMTASYAERDDAHQRLAAWEAQRDRSVTP